MEQEQELLHCECGNILDTWHDIPSEHKFVCSVCYDLYQEGMQAAVDEQKTMAELYNFGKL